MDFPPLFSSFAYPSPQAGLHPRPGLSTPASQALPLAPPGADLHGRLARYAAPGPGWSLLTPRWVDGDTSPRGRSMLRVGGLLIVDGAMLWREFQRMAAHLGLQPTEGLLARWLEAMASQAQTPPPGRLPGLIRYGAGPDDELPIAPMDQRMPFWLGESAPLSEAAYDGPEVALSPAGPGAGPSSASARVEASADGMVLSLYAPGSDAPHCVLDRSGPRPLATVHGEPAEGLLRPAFELAWALLSAFRRVVPREELVAAGWPARDTVPDTSLKRMLSSVRNILGLNEACGVSLTGMPAIGYRLDDGLLNLPDDTLTIFKHVRLDPFGRRALVDEHHEVHLDPLECDLMVFLIANVGRSFSRREMMEAVWGEYKDVSDSMIEHLFSHVRSKLRLDAAHGVNLGWRANRCQLTDLDQRIDQQTPEGLFQLGDILVDPFRRIALVDGQEVGLEPLEWKFARVVGGRLNRPVPTQEMTHAVWGEGVNVTSTMLHQTSGGMRRKLQLDAAHGWAMEGKVAVGYRLRELALGIDGLPADTLVRFQHVILDPFGDRAQVDGEEVSLAPIEIVVARWLFAQAGRIHTYDELVDAIWGAPRSVDYVRSIVLSPLAKTLKLDRAHGLELRMGDDQYGLLLPDGVAPHWETMQALAELDLFQIDHRMGRSLPRLIDEALTPLAWQVRQRWPRDALRLEDAAARLHDGEPILPPGLELQALNTPIGPVDLHELDRGNGYLDRPYPIAYATMMRDLFIANAAGIVTIAGGAAAFDQGGVVDRVVRERFRSRQKPISPLPIQAPWHDTLVMGYFAAHRTAPPTRREDVKAGLLHFVHTMGRRHLISERGLQAAYRSLGLRSP